jgi:hypothetical protein
VCVLSVAENFSSRPQLVKVATSESLPQDTPETPCMRRMRSELQRELSLQNLDCMPVLVSVLSETRLIDSISVKPTPALSPKPAGIHHFDQQRARPVLGIAQPLLQHVHDVEADIETDEIGQRERTHGMRHA